MPVWRKLAEICFYTGKTESIELYTLNARLSGWNLATSTPHEWCHLLPKGEENLAQHSLPEPPPIMSHCHVLKHEKSPPTPFIFDPPPAESFFLSPSISLHSHSILNFHPLLAPKSSNLASFSSFWSRIHGFLLLIMDQWLI